MFKVGFFQWQSSKNLPHMNMPLFVTDIKNIGCAFECICISETGLACLLRHLKKVKFDLVAIDCSFPITFINKLKEICPDTKLVTGGSGFFDAFFKSGIDFAIIGAGREGFLKLTEALKNKGNLDNIPNLFFKNRKGGELKIDYTGKTVPFNLKKELFPYRPYLKWKYLGFKQPKKGGETKLPTIVADFGCPHRAHKLNQHYRDVAMEPLGSEIFTERARRRLENFFKERMRGGCSFCAYYSYAALPVDETVNCLMRQLRFLQKRYGYEEFALGSEYPFRFMLKLINQIIKEKLKIKQLYLRSRPDWINQHRKRLIEILKLAKAINLKINLWQVGFESFFQKDLDIYNKGCRVSENWKTVKLISNLQERYPKDFLSHPTSHGYLTINPWINFKDIETYLKSKQDIIGQNFGGNWLTLYDRFLPIYQKLRKDGLLIKYKTRLDGYKFKDKNVALFLNISSRLEKHLRGKPFLHYHDAVLKKVKKNVFTAIKNRSCAKSTKEFKQEVLAHNKQYIDQQIAEKKNLSIKSAIDIINSSSEKKNLHLIRSLYNNTKLADIRTFKIKGKECIFNSKHNKTYPASAADKAIMDAMRVGVEINELLEQI
ncbi:hypothetical protein ACFL2I_07205 [Candidatus Omnitrophota bacterium]